MSNPYPGGQCTWGAAEMFPCLQNISQYGNFGNGGDWFAHAQQIGLPTSPSPVAGWLASFSTEGWPSGPGDVGLIQSVNNDGTVTRYGVNWHMDGKWSTDRIRQSLIIGAFQPPCSVSASSGIQTLSSTSSSGCRWQWTGQLFGPFNISVCFDGLVGLIAFAGGITIITIGLAMMVVALGYHGKNGKQTVVVVEEKPTESTTEPASVPASAPSNTVLGDRSDIVNKARQRALTRDLQYRRALPAPSSKRS